MSDSKALEALGSMNIDDIEIVPGFKVPSEDGEYRVLAEWTAKEINGKNNLVLEMECLEDQEGVCLKGDKFTMLFNDEGIKYNRDLLVSAKTHWNANTLGELVEAGQIEIGIVLKRREDKKDPEKVYAQVKKFNAL